ncbi:mycothiol transferase [Streptomyces sp. NBC_01591]
MRFPRDSRGSADDEEQRMVMVHVLLEYGRHNGHAGFLREGFDGTVGA